MDYIEKLRNWKLRMRGYVNKVFLLFIILSTTLIWTDEKSKNTSPESKSKQNPLIQDTSKKNVKTTKDVKSKNNKYSHYTSEQLDTRREHIVKVLKYGSNRERIDIMKDLAFFPTEKSEEIYKIIAETLQTDLDISIKISCVRTFTELGLSRESKAIVDTLKEESEDLKEVAISAITKLKIEEGAPAIFNLLKKYDFSRNQTILNQSINALAELESGKIAMDFLESKFKDKTTNIETKATITLYFGKMKDPRIESVLIDTALNDKEDLSIRSYAISALGKIQSKNAIDPIRKILKEIRENKNKTDAKKLASLKMYALSALVILGDKDVLKELIAYSKDDDPTVRIRAIQQLGDLDDLSVKELIEYKATKDPNKKVQIAAKKVLEEMNKREIKDPNKSDPINQLNIDGTKKEKSNDQKSNSEQIRDNNLVPDSSLNKNK